MILPFVRMFIEIVQCIVHVLDQKVSVIFEEGPQFVGKRIDRMINDESLRIVAPRERRGHKNAEVDQERDALSVNAQGF